MQSKFDKLNDLPQELKVEIAQNLPLPDLANFSKTSKYQMGLFKPQMEERKELHAFLRHVAWGEYEAVQAMLKKNMSLLFKRDMMKDCSGRTFECISGFEYALWALDKHMWTAMIECIPQDEDGKQVIAKLIDQYNNVDTCGVTYTLDGKTIAEKHFDFENTIIKEIKTLIKSLSSPLSYSPAIDKQRVEGIGGAQKRLPMHVIDEYCSEQKLSPLPQFTSRPKSSRTVYYWDARQHENWFSLHSKLGSEFAIIKVANGATGLNRGRGGDHMRALYSGELAFVNGLYKVRTQDFGHLKLQLEKQMAADSQLQDYPM